MKKLISWNVNGIRAIEKKGFLDWLFIEEPDVLCLQETKAREDQLTSSLLKPSNNATSYKTYWSSSKQAGYSGVAIFSKDECQNVRLMNIKEIDDEGRVLVVEYNTYFVISSYFPNSQEGGARLPYKLFFCQKMLELCNSLSKNKNIILLGDYNIAHKPIDLANPQANEGNPGYFIEEREWMDHFIQQGYVDTFRHFCTLPKMYTWWTYRYKAREKNIGWRIDYASVNKNFISYVKSSTIMSNVTGSDHCPIKIELDI